MKLLCVTLHLVAIVAFSLALAFWMTEVPIRFGWIAFSLLGQLFNVAMILRFVNLIELKDSQ